MNTTDRLEQATDAIVSKPGAKLASIREQKGYNIEYVASKLHLRVRVIELLETDAYDEMPESVFIKGYLRAYANLLEVDFEPLLVQFNSLYLEDEQPAERMLWQSTKKPAHRTEHWIRWGTAFFAVAVVVAVFGWWIKSKDVESLFSRHVGVAKIDELTDETEVRLTDLSSMRSLLSSKNRLPSLESKDD